MGELLTSPSTSAEASSQVDVEQVAARSGDPAGMYRYLEQTGLARASAWAA